MTKTYEKTKSWLIKNRHIYFMSIFLAMLIPLGMNAQTTYTVGPGTGYDFSTIPAAITAASDGDIIEVAAGTYTDNVSVTKSLTINGPNAGIDPNTGTRGPEAILKDATFTINTANKGNRCTTL